jgi:hypothetical protein
MERPTEREAAMPLFMDVHSQVPPDADPEAVAAAH